MEFVLVALVLIPLFAAILQLALALHVRNTIVASAAAGARHGANADRDAADGAAYTQRLVAGALSARFADDVSAGYETVGGVPTVYVRVRADLPVLGFIGVGAGMDVRGNALREGG